MRKFDSKEREVWPYCLLLSASDTTDLDYFPQAIRIYNPNGTVSTVKIDTVLGDTITLIVPANSVTIQEIQVSKLYSTGTTPQCIVHGLYSRSTKFPPPPAFGVLGINFSNPNNSQYLLTLII